MAIPTFVNAGTKGEGTTGATPGMPAGLTTGDLLLAFCEYSNSGTCSVSAQGGGSWTSVGNIQSSATATTMAAVWVFSDYYNGSQTAPSFASPGNHMCAGIVAISGARSADEIAFGGTGSGTDISGDANVSIASGFSTSDADCLIVAGFAFFDDNPTFGLTWSNANLGSVTRRINFSTISGNDGTLNVVTGTLATAGAVGTFTNTATGAGESAGFIIAVRPPAAAGSIAVPVTSIRRYHNVPWDSWA